MWTRLCVCGVALLAALQLSAGDHYHAGFKLSNKYGAAPAVVGLHEPKEHTPLYWNKNAAAAIRSKLPGVENTDVARNVIFFIGDGMSIPTLTAARTLLGQRAGGHGENYQLSFETFPVTGLSKTYCVDMQIPDSACTANAYHTGVKNNFGTIGITAAVQRYDCYGATNKSHQLDSIAVWALKDGRDAGIVTTTRVTHASPSGAYAHTADRDWESDSDITDCTGPVQDDIALQLATHYPGTHLKVILGGGRQMFLPNVTGGDEFTSGHRQDGKNLIEEWKKDKMAKGKSYSYVKNKAELNKVNYNKTNYLLGLFAASHLEYNQIADESQPRLADMTEAAIKMLSKNDRGYFLFVEGGRIDHAHHDNYPKLALDETIELSDAVARAVALTDVKDTLIVVSSDHAHVMNINGYTRRGGDILGPSDQRDDNEVPYMTLSYGNGPGYRNRSTVVNRADITADTDIDKPMFRAETLLPLGSETHGGDDVGVFARGPRAHMFTGMYEQSHLPHLMGYAACIGAGHTACDNNQH